MQTTKTKRARHASPRNRQSFGRQRRAELRNDREAVIILLHPSLFERQVQEAA